MKNAFVKAEELAGAIKEYLDTRIESVKINAAEKSSGLIANVLAAIVVGVGVLFFIFFASLALSVRLGEWIGKAWAGHLIISCLYLFIGIMVWKSRGKLIRFPIMNALIKQLFNKDDED